MAKRLTALDLSDGEHQKHGYEKELLEEKHDDFNCFSS